MAKFLESAEILYSYTLTHSRIKPKDKINILNMAKLVNVNYAYIVLFIKKLLTKIRPIFFFCNVLALVSLQFFFVFFFFFGGGGGEEGFCSIYILHGFINNIEMILKSWKSSKNYASNN